MSAQVWPYIPPDQVAKEIESSLAAELEWLLNLLQEQLASLKSGLHECLALLAPEEPGSTLALSSLRSESVKGVVTRVGTRIIKGDIYLRLLTLPPPRSSPSYAVHLSQPIPLSQLTQLITLLNNALDIIDISLWTGDPQNASFISGQLKLLDDTISEARSTLNGSNTDTSWFDEPHDVSSFDPHLAENLSVHLSIVDAALVLVVRVLAPVAEAEGLSLTGLSLRTRLGLTAKPPIHDESEQVFHFKGEEVAVREKMRVESQDPSLMAAMAKLSALGHAVESWRLKVRAVMGEDGE